jgi:hypothetical protein
MQCLHPVTIKNPLYVGSDAYLPYQRERSMLVPCGDCASCHTNKRRDWFVRLSLVMKSCSFAVFVTLTYDDEHLPKNGDLVKADLQRFVKRLRINGSRQKFASCLFSSIKYFASGEYGETYGRPHYHLLIFGMSATFSADTRLLLRSWSFGNIDIRPCSPAAINYVSGYVCKSKLYRDSLPVPQFMIASNGLGASVLDNLPYYEISKDRILSVRIDGSVYPMPRYCREKLFDYFAKNSKRVSDSTADKSDSDIQKILFGAEKRMIKYEVMKDIPDRERVSKDLAEYLQLQFDLRKFMNKKSSNL